MKCTVGRSLSFRLLETKVKLVKTLKIKKAIVFFFGGISNENFIQSQKKEPPKYIGSIQQGTKTIKYTNYKHQSNHEPKK